MTVTGNICLRFEFRLDVLYILGNAESAFKEIKSIALTEQSAIRLFGNDWRNQDILGKTVQIIRDG
ncbi:MAG: hypothetical protein RLP11_15745, partial [Marinoscillum sp.]|uniref:hypothetical protein n=1 Tax=Marinoscillum sp. TaxID=2024838 RepID=UPI0033034F7E